MKLVRLKPGSNLELWRFVSEQLPRGLRATKTTAWHGDILGIQVKEPAGEIFGIKKWRTIANVTHNSVELLYPEWFSDLEEIIKRYEHITAKEVTFRYWES